VSDLPKESTGDGIQYRFGFDIGGTFTDLVLLGTNGTVHTGKVLSRSSNVAQPIITGLRSMLAEHQIPASQVSEVVAGATTAVSNLVIERKGAITALVTTAGFRDIIEIGREIRYDIYDLRAVYPDCVVPRPLRFEIDERVDNRGAVLCGPSDVQIEDLAHRLKSCDVQSVAVCFLHAFTNPTHEILVRDILNRVAPHISVSLSSEVLGEIREYERIVATVLNAYAMPLVGRYLAEIEAALKAMGIAATLQVMQSNGGRISRSFGERMPIRLLESGPAAGAIAAAYSARQAHVGNIVAFDMGGTTAKACLVMDGEPDVTTEFEVARVHRFKRGSGLPIRLPVVDLIEIGAGGGSIAHIDVTGLMKVGPQSAGSDPGPACYGLGGSEPTVTDAALLLGYLDPSGSLSGQVKLRPDLAEQAIRTHIAEPLGMSVLEAASGIHRIVSENMASAVKIHVVEKGRDVRRFSLFAFGGAGPIHAREIARRAGCREILIPRHAGVLSAFGLLVAPMRVDTSRSRYARLENIDWEEIDAVLADMERAIAAELVAAGVVATDINYRRTADMRYVGQGFEVTTELPPHASGDRNAMLTRAFNASYVAKFGRSLATYPIELINLRVGAFTRSGSPVAQPVTNGAQAGADVPRCRDVYFPDVNAFVMTPVVAETELESGRAVSGPILIEQPGTTIIVGPGDRCSTVDHLIRIESGVAQ
jgi:N-methylhydantoinase A